MATTTPNFGWPVPTSTDLVKDGATAIEALGDGIDTSLVDLKGGTTGQVLSKTTSADMDFTWVTTDDANAIQNSIVDAKGDIVAASANDTPARLAVGANGETIVADSSTSTGLRWQGDYAAGKNFLINSNFANWQRGTTLTYTSSGLNYLPDRFFSWTIGTLDVTVSQQTFTPGTAPVAGYEGQYFLRNAVTSLSGQSIQAVGQRIEDVRTLAGQTATFSFWAKADASRTYTTRLIQNFGSGGSGEVATANVSHSVTTSWQRFSVTVSIPSISGKTIGTSSYLQPLLDGPANTANTLDTWGWQLEAGSVATAFQTATGTIQGELAACQRYYQKSYPAGLYPGASFPGGYSVTIVENNIPNSNYYHFQPLIVQTRAEPTITIYSGSGATNKVSTNGGSDLATNSAVAALITDNHFTITNSSGGALTASAGGFLFFYTASAEL